MSKWIEALNMAKKTGQESKLLLVLMKLNISINHLKQF